jgi:hypothetical protein
VSERDHGSRPLHGSTHRPAGALGSHTLLLFRGWAGRPGNRAFSFAKAALYLSVCSPPCTAHRELFQDGYDAQGNRVYDKVNGLTCHQCRQKTLGKRTSCAGCHSLQVWPGVGVGCADGGAGPLPTVCAVVQGAVPVASQLGLAPRPTSHLPWLSSTHAVMLSPA